MSREDEFEKAIEQGKDRAATIVAALDQTKKRCEALLEKASPEDKLRIEHNLEAIEFRLSIFRWELDQASSSLDERRGL